MDSRDYALQLAATEAEYKQVKAEAERVIRLYENRAYRKTTTTRPYQASSR